MTIFWKQVSPASWDYQMYLLFHTQGAEVQQQKSLGEGQAGFERNINPWVLSEGIWTP